MRLFRRHDSSRCPGARATPYTPDQCRICWLETFSRVPDHSAIVDTRGPERLQCEFRETAPTGLNCLNLTLMGEKSLITLQDCSKCVQRKKPTPSPNPAVPLVCEPARPLLDPIRRVRVQESLFPPAERNFQASVVFFNGTYWMAHRQNWANAKTCLSRLDDHFQPVWTRVLPLPSGMQFPLAASGQEDGRLFIWKNSLWLAWTAYTKLNLGEPGSVTTVVYSELDANGGVKKTVVPQWIARRDWEKNWAFFPWKNRLFAVYQVAPSQIVLEIDDTAVELASDLPLTFPANMGLQRGGASPFFNDGLFWHVTHGVYLHPENNHQWYNAGLYAFEAKPPFRPAKFLPFPLICPRIDPPSHGISTNPRVVFPCGAFVRGNSLFVSSGWHDRWLEVWEFDWQEVKKHVRSYT